MKISKKHIGILGGSFDPAHHGHLNISKIAIKKLNLDKVYWVITGKNPFKKKAFYSLDKRKNYAKKITKNHKKIKVLYLDKVVKSANSINIINYFLKKRKLKNICFLIGSDNMIDFHRWKSWKKIVKLVKLVVFSRKGYDKKGLKSIVAKYLKNKIIFIDNKHLSFSSTKIRRQSQKKF